MLEEVQMLQQQMDVRTRTAGVAAADQVHDFHSCLRAKSLYAGLFWSTIFLLLYALHDFQSMPKRWTTRMPARVPFRRIL